MKTLINRIRGAITRRLKAYAAEYLTRRGYLVVGRSEWLQAQAVAYNVEMRCRRLGGGNASKLSLRARNKRLRRAAIRWRSSLAGLGKVGHGA